MTNNNSLEWRLQKGDLQPDIEVISRENYHLHDGRSIAGQLDGRQADTVYFVDGEGKLRKNSLIYEADACGNIRGDIEVTNREIKRNPLIDGLIANIHLPIIATAGGLAAGIGAMYTEDVALDVASSSPFNALALGIGATAIAFVSYIAAWGYAMANGSGDAWKKYKERSR